MKILSLEIENIRGIKNIKIKPNGRNIVVYGPNGTGKSAVVDAIDFLLTGEISRLTGEGTKSLSLKAHGPHIDSRKKLENTLITAKVEIKGKEVILERSIKRPSSLRVMPKKHKSSIRPYLRTAELGLHILCRKDILKYVTAEAGKRAKEVMNLLNLQHIENIRSNLVTIRNESIQAFKQAKNSFEISQGDVSKLLSLDVFSEESVLKRVNRLRKDIHGSNITKLSREAIRGGLTPYPYGTEKVLTGEQVTNIIKEIRAIIDQKDDLTTKELKLRTLLKKTVEEKGIEQLLIYEKLFEIGLGLVDESNRCPLCARKWRRGDFKEYLRRKRQQTKAIQERQTKIEDLSALISLKLRQLKDDVGNCLRACKDFDLRVVEKKKLNKLLSKIDSWLEAMNKPLESFKAKRWPSGLRRIFEIDFLEKRILAPLEKASQLPKFKFSLKQRAWDTLTRMEDYWARYQETRKKKDNTELFKKRAETTLHTFEKARDTILETIYGTVKNDFEEFYKTIHKDDEKNFRSSISPKGPELDFKVDFYKRGMFPPHALHSEGHQDSTGLCLFLALNKFLVKDGLGIIVLDDVIMSIDRTHRRGICHLMKENFAEKQYIITTHENDWANQLRTEGIVTRKNMIHFANWNIDAGPRYKLEKDFWDEIDDDLKNNNIPSAAHKLRRNSECFFELVCDFLEAEIPYRGNHRWELGDLAPAAISTYKKYLKKAKTNSQKIGQNKKFSELNKLEKASSKIIAKSQVEQWIINENVHYNKWTEFSKNDFEPVVDAFRDLYSLFICKSCGSMISKCQARGTAANVVVNCDCGKIFWNIQ